MDQRGVEDTVFCDVNITTCYSCTCTAKFAHMNGHWKAYDTCKFIPGAPFLVRVSKVSIKDEYTGLLIVIVSAKGDRHPSIAKN